MSLSSSCARCHRRKLKLKGSDPETFNSRCFRELPKKRKEKKKLANVDVSFTPNLTLAKLRVI